MINTVKTQGKGYLVDGTKYVPSDPRNKDYQAIQKWIEEGNEPEPEFTDEELETQRIESIKQEAKKQILSVMNEEQQRNSLAELFYYATLATKTDEETALANEHLAKWEAINNIRQVSNRAEADGTALEDIQW